MKERGQRASEEEYECEYEERWKLERGGSKRERGGVAVGVEVCVCAGRSGRADGDLVEGRGTFS
jgi:hypothetical protein